MFKYLAGFFIANLQLTFLGALSLVLAENSTVLHPEQDLSTVQQEINSSGVLSAQIKQQIALSLAEEAALSAQLITLAKTLQTQEAGLQRSEDVMAKLKKEEIVIRADLAGKEALLSELLAGLQRLEQNPPPPLVVAPDDVLAALRGAMMFGLVVPEMQAEAALLQQKLQSLADIHTQQADAKQTILSSLAKIKDTQRGVDSLMAQKKSLILQGNQQLSAEKKRQAALVAKAATLQQLIQSLALERERLAAEKTRNALALEAERARQAAAMAGPSMIFAESLGKLEYPAQGQILKRFGDADGLGSNLQGLAIATHKEAQIVAPFDGKVEFAGPFRSYGQLLILNPGGNYLVLLAGMRQISVEIGQMIRKGEPVGVMGAGPSSVTLLGDQLQEPRPVLYVEFRKNGAALDSAPWWIDGVKEAKQ